MDREVKPGRVLRSHNEITFRGNFGIQQIRGAVAALHDIEKRGYDDVLFNFARCESAFPGSMSMLCALALRIREQGVSTTALPPEDPRLKSLFSRANWLHLLAPESIPAVTSMTASLSINVPASQFRSDKEQQLCVATMINRLLSMRSDLTRRDLAAIEWCLGEVTGNVLTHSQSPVGGIVQLNSYRKSNRVEVVVADPGLSIPGTLCSAHAYIRTDIQALEEATKEGVTRSKAEGMGNGLFGTYQLATQTKNGYLNISSRYAHLGFSADQGSVMQTTKTPIPGTLVVAAIGASQPGAIHSALRFQSGLHEPLDSLEIAYEQDESNLIDVDIATEVDSVFSREAARALRHRIENLLEMLPLHRVAIHFGEVELISSSFADECFGKLARQIGLHQMQARVTLEDASGTIRDLINHSILQRLQTP